MPFDSTQITGNRTREIYKGLKEEGKLKTSMVDLLCTKVPKSAISTHEGKIASLDFQAMAAATGLTGFTALDAASEEMETPVSDRDFKIQKIQKHKSYARGLDGDELFVKIKDSFIPHLDTQIGYEKDAELKTILSGAGTATTNAQDVTKRQLSAASNQQWTQTGSDPLGDLRSAVQDSLADTVYLGTAKANAIQDHAQLQSQSGMQYATQDALARYLEGFLGVRRVIIQDRVYQNGAISAAADLKYLNADMACVYNSANLLYLDWSGPEFVNDDVVNKNVRELHAIVHGAIVVVNPLYFIGFEDVA